MANPPPSPCQSLSDDESDDCTDECTTDTDETPDDETRDSFEFVGSPVAMLKVSGSALCRRDSHL